LKKVAIIQARLGSSRLPGKVLLEVAGEPMLARVVARVRQARLIDEIMIATTSDLVDDPLVQYCHDASLPCYRGDQFDVLDRFYQAARQAQADVIVRITADCPMIAPEEIDRVVWAYLSSGADFAANRLPPPFERTTPIGMDTEVCSMQALEKAWREAEQPYQREHVMPYLYDTEGRFKVQVVNLEPAQGHLRFTVDTAEDLHLANQIYAAFEGRNDFSLEQLLAENERHPEWQQQVALVHHKDLYETDQRAKPASKQKDEEPKVGPIHATPNQPMRNEAPVISCPLCGSDRIKDFEQVESFGYPVEYLICQDCGFVFQNPQTSQATNPDFYLQDYRQIYQASEQPTQKDLYQQTQRANNQAEWLKSHGLEKFENVLDIGASSGLLLETFAQRFGADVVGVEPGDAYRALAEAKGLCMHSSIETLIASSPKRFELVTLMHVLEHLERPRQVLEQIREELLNDEGLLLVEVPNFYAHDSYELAHLSCFTEHTLLETLRQAGFEQVASRSHGMPRSAILPLYLTILAKPVLETDRRPPKPEKGVRLKRRLAMLKRKILTRLNPDRAWLPVEGK